MTTEHKNSGTGMNTSLVWMGVGVGAAIGVAVALNRRKRSGWYTATRRVADKTNDLAVVSKDMLERIKVIYAETRKVVDEATELWSQGRKLVGV
jgi:gas vesicle protein